MEVVQAYAPLAASSRLQLTGSCQVSPQEAFPKAVLPHAVLHQKHHGKGTRRRCLLRWHWPACQVGFVVPGVCFDERGSLPPRNESSRGVPYQLISLLCRTAVLYTVGDWQALAELLLPAG